MKKFGALVLSLALVPAFACKSNDYEEPEERETATETYNAPSAANDPTLQADDDLDNARADNTWNNSAGGSAAGTPPPSDSYRGTEGTSEFGGAAGAAGSADDDAYEGTAGSPGAAGGASEPMAENPAGGAAGSPSMDDDFGGDETSEGATPMGAGRDGGTR